MRKAAWLLAALVVIGGGVWLVLASNSGPQPGQVKDEALRAGLAATYFRAADDYDLFKDMDGGVIRKDDPGDPDAADEIKGRNMWMVWTGGNDQFWDALIRRSFGTFDLLKSISSAPGSPFGRDNRWQYFDIVNEPCFDKATAPDPKR